MKKSVKLISILLSVLMIAAIFTSLPITANAEETNDVVDKAGFAVSAEDDGSADGFDLAEEIVSKLENSDKDQASVGTEAGESVGDNVASNMQIIRNYINSHYDTIDEEGKKVTVTTEDNYGNEMKIYLILCDNDLISLSMHYYISDNVCVIADINEVDFSKSLKFFPHVTLWEGNTMHFLGKIFDNNLKLS